MCRAVTSAGRQLCRRATAAPVPAAWPITAQVAITRVEDRAMWVALMLRPANSRLGTLSEYRERKGIWYGVAGVMCLEE